MGNYVSKYVSRNAEIESHKAKPREEENDANNVYTNEGSGSSSCVTVPSAVKQCEKLMSETPKMNARPIPLDPRSVTAGITRTPIEIDCTPVTVRRSVSAIPRYLQSREKYLETDMDKVMPRLKPKKRCVPRIAKSAESSLWKSEVGTLAMDKNEPICLTPTANTIKSIDCQKLTPIEKDRYKILGIDPRSPAIEFDRTPIILPKPDEHRRLMESLEESSRRGSYDADGSCSNFSYCETSSQFIHVPEIQALPDMVTRALKSMNLEEIGSIGRCEELNESSFSCNFETDTFSENSGDEDDTDRTKKINSECLRVEDKSTEKENDKLEPEDETLTKRNNDNRKIIIWNDSASLEESNDSEGRPIDESSIEAIKLKVYDATKNGCSNKISTKLEHDVQATQNKTYITGSAKFNRITNKRENETTKTRTPLGNRSNNGQAQGLSLNSPQQLFRKKNAAAKALQENTPPHKNCTVKSKLTGVQWDPDSTVLI